VDGAGVDAAFTAVALGTTVDAADMQDAAPMQDEPDMPVGHAATLAELGVMRVEHVERPRRRVDIAAAQHVVIAAAVAVDSTAAAVVEPMVAVAVVTGKPTARAV